VRPKKSADHRIERAQPPTSPFSRPRLAFARDDASASDKRPDKPERILVVEDDFLVAAQMEAALMDAGFDVAGVAWTGEDAIRLAAAKRPRLVVMDIRLAGDRDGVDTALELFADHGIRCIFATAHHDERVRERAAPAAPLGWLAKPYTTASLIEAVRHAIDALRGNR